MESTLPDSETLPDAVTLGLNKMTSCRSPGELTLNALLTTENMLKI